jgi:hypothetical protein
LRVDELLRDAWERIPVPGDDDSRMRFTAALAQPPRRRPRRLLAAAIVLGLVLVTAPALGGNPFDRVVRLFSDDPPQELVEDLARLDRGAPEGHGVQPIVGETRLLLRGWNQAGEYRLWQTPTKRGRLCLSFEAPLDGKTQHMTTTCPPANVRRPVDLYSAASASIPSIGYLIGRVAPAVGELRLEYVNGGLERISLHNGFFVASIEGVRMIRGSDHPTRLVGLDAHGDVVGIAADVARAYSHMPFGNERPPVAVLDDERPLIRVQLERSEATLHGSPSRLGGSCGRLEAAGRNWLWFCGDPDKPRAPLQLTLHRLPDGAGAATVLAGMVKSGLELRFEYEDGAIERPRVADGWFLARVLPEHEPRGHRLANVVAEGAGETVRVPMATQDDALYEGPPDRPTPLPVRQSGPLPDWPLVATLAITTERAGSARVEIRRKDEREWHERLLVGGRVFGDVTLRWFPDEHEKDASISAEWIPVLSDDGKRDAYLFSGTARRGNALRAVYADGSSEPVPLVAPAKPVGGIRGFFLFEVTPLRRERGLARFEALTDGAVVARYVVPAETGSRRGGK